jgi:hypothetical protein
MPYVTEIYLNTNDFQLDWENVREEFTKNFNSSIKFYINY